MVARPLPVDNGVSTRTWSASINGKGRQIIIRDHDILLDVLRDGVGALGAKRGCDMGTCGCCSVLIDGKPKLSCMTLAVETDGCELPLWRDSQMVIIFIQYKPCLQNAAGVSAVTILLAFW